MYGSVSVATRELKLHVYNHQDSPHLPNTCLARAGVAIRGYPTGPLPMLSILCFIHSLVGSERVSGDVPSSAPTCDALQCVTSIMKTSEAKQSHEDTIHDPVPEQQFTHEPRHHLVPDPHTSSTDPPSPDPHTSSTDPPSPNPHTSSTDPPSPDPHTFSTDPPSPRLNPYSDYNRPSNTVQDLTIDYPPSSRGYVVVADHPTATDDTPTRRDNHSSPDLLTQCNAPSSVVPVTSSSKQGPSRGAPSSRGQHTCKSTVSKNRKRKKTKSESAGTWSHPCQESLPSPELPRNNLLRASEVCPSDSGGYSPPPGRFAQVGKLCSPGKYQSSTLGRPSRRGRLVITPKPPDICQRRGSRSQTEPPTNLPSPDLLQVTWVWESRPLLRAATIRRRPSCRVACRRRSRPCLAPRRAPSSSSSASHRSHSPVNGGSEVEHDKGFCSGGELSDNSENAHEDDKVMAAAIVMPDVVLLNTGGESWPSSRCEESCGQTKSKPEPCADQQEVRLRNKPNPSYLRAAKTLKQKWRNSELYFPRLLNETLYNTKSDEASNARKSLFEKARDLPLQMRKFSYLLFKNGKDVKNVDVVMKNGGSSKFYLEMKDYPVGCIVRRRSVRRPSAPPVLHSSTGVKRNCSFSPRNSVRQCKTLNWNQKYKTVMDSRREAGMGCGPAIHITTAEDQVVPGYQDDCEHLAVTQDDRKHGGEALHPYPLHHQGPERDKKKHGGVLDRLLGRLRPRSLSTSRSWASSRSSMSGGSEDGQSPSHSSDYEEQEEGERTGSASLVGRMRGLRRDMQKKISRLKSPRGSTSSSPGPVANIDKAGASLIAPAHQQPTASSYESIPTSAPLATTASGSNRSSLSGEEAEPYTGPFIGRARALVDCQPSPYDRDALKFKKGDVIDIIAKNPSGLWKGCVDGRVGHFKFILVEEEVERPARRSRAWRGTTPRRGRARTLEELLTRLHLGHLIQVFVLNGYEDLDQFRDLEKADLDCLGITDPETCAKLLTAVALLHDADSEPEPDPPETLDTTEAALQRGDHGRDSGCYTDHRSTHTVVLDENNLDTRQSTPSTDNSSGYHSRGAYNIPVGDTTQTSRDDPHSSALDSPSSESTATAAGAALPSTQAESHSYRAHLATVLPASPRSQSRHSQQGEQKQRQDSQVDYEAKFVTARSVFEKEVVRREVPFTVRAQKRSMGSSHSLTGETEDGAKYDVTVAAPELPSP
ncbi:SAM and SH3 domain-containing protein 3-like [Homarus americanus]|uniref:SAM and SH3 domain-containing protein 3-like n=1 Tax=Homarus americanus TaxID=6706 RepID=A0A8J5JR04_HOMAM|nr:SAM and SH3 domain-containing protein 3-like [Homarus americanus]